MADATIEGADIATIEGADIEGADLSIGTGTSSAASIMVAATDGLMAHGDPFP